MHYVKEFVRRSLNVRSICCVLSVLLILMFAVGVTTLSAYFSSSQRDVCVFRCQGRSGQSSEQRSLLVHVVFRAMFTFVAVSSVGVTVAVCLFVLWSRRVHARKQDAAADQHAARDPDAIGKGCTSDEAVAAEDVTVVCSTNSDLDRSLLRSDVGHSDQ